MKKSFILILYLASFIPCLLLAGAGLYPTVAFAVEVAPRISDKEIIEGLAEIRGDIKRLEAEMKAEINGVKAEIRAVDKRFDAVDKRFDDMNKRFDDLRFMLGLFITISLVILGFVLHMQWQMHKKQAQVETTLETQKDELSFLKTLIEKLLPPRSVL